MRVFHFTARHHLGTDAAPLARTHAGPGIRRAGILPNAHPGIQLPPMVWLTTDESFDQAWAPAYRVAALGCDRTEVRLEVTIPKSGRPDLIAGPDLIRFMSAEVWALLTRYHAPGPWHVFLGRIPTGWIRGVELRPDLR